MSGAAVGGAAMGGGPVGGGGAPVGGAAVGGAAVGGGPVGGGGGAALLLTGADGYLGGRLLRRWLCDTDLAVVATVRAADAAQLDAKAQRIRGSLPASHQARVDVVPADLCLPDPFAAVGEAHLAAVRAIVHTAAVTRFNVAYDLARATNVGGAVALARLARRCPRLEAVGLCSTLYATGLRAGTIGEEDQEEPPGFANHYEWSKFAAERAALAAAPELPWRILRLATIVCDDVTGEVGQQNAFHRTLRLCQRGLLPVLPGDPEVPLYLVSARFCEDAVFGLLRPEVPGGTYHLSHGRAAALTLGQLVARAYQAFRSAEGFRRRNLLVPPFVDPDEFQLVASARSRSLTPILHQVLSTVTPFARQLYVHKDVSVARLNRIVAPPPPPEQLVEATVRHLLDTEWGARAAA